MKKPILLISLLTCLFFSACSPPPTNPTLRVGDVVVIDSWVFGTGEFTINSLSQDGSKFRIEGDPRYWDTDDYQFHIIRRTSVQPKQP